MQWPVKQNGWGFKEHKQLNKLMSVVQCKTLKWLNTTNNCVCIVICLRHPSANTRLVEGWAETAAPRYCSLVSKILLFSSTRWHIWPTSYSNAAASSISVIWDHSSEPQLLKLLFCNSESWQTCTITRARFTCTWALGHTSSMGPLK